MRLTWVVLGVVAAAGVIAFLSGTSSEEPATTTVAGTSGVGTPGARALRRDDQASALDDDLDVLDPVDDNEADEARAQQVHLQLAKAEAAGDASAVAKLEATLRDDLSDTLVARRRAFRHGLAMLGGLKGRKGEDRIRHLDASRRLLSAGVYLPEHFHKDGRSTARRTKLLRKLDEINRIVMTYAPGLEGVTEQYDVPSGIAPVQIVSRKKLPFGHNALLLWNQGGNLDPSSLRAGARFLLPQEELTVHVHQNYRRMGLFLGNWFIKEFRVGIGKDTTPTPVGSFLVYRKQMNPDWTATIEGRKVVIPYGDPRNELGDVWIHIRNAQYTHSYGLHGTNAPETVGTACSNGCVRLKNDHARELFFWVRTASHGGDATRVFLRYGPIPGSAAPAPPR